jgi:hypothetical protein
MRTIIRKRAVRVGLIAAAVFAGSRDRVRDDPGQQRRLHGVQAERDRDDQAD